MTVFMFRPTIEGLIPHCNIHVSLRSRLLSRMFVVIHRKHDFTFSLCCKPYQFILRTRQNKHYRTTIVTALGEAWYANSGALFAHCLCLFAVVLSAACKHKLTELPCFWGSHYPPVIVNTMIRNEIFVLNDKIIAKSQ